MQNQDRRQAGGDKTAPGKAPSDKAPSENQASLPAAESQASEKSKPGVGDLQRNPKPASRHPMA
jgi:hypothetical protein